MIIGDLQYTIGTKPGDLEKLQAHLTAMESAAASAGNAVGNNLESGSRKATKSVQELRNVLRSLNGALEAGKIAPQEYARAIDMVRVSALNQMQALTQAGGAAALTTSQYAGLASIAGVTSHSMQTLDSTTKQATASQTVLMGAVRAARFQLVRMGPIGYGTSVMMTSIASSMKSAEYGTVGLDGKVQRLRATLLTLNNVILLSGIGALITLGVVAHRASRAIVSLEDAQAEVRRTTGFTGDELNELTQSFQSISMEIGSTTNDMMEIAAVAGQLGLRGVRNISEFSDTLMRLSLVSDVTGREGATQLARFLNITGTAMADMGQEALLAGNIINQLGNTTAASAAEVLKMASEIAQVTAVANVSRPDIIAIGAALKSVGISAELAGTNLTKVFDKMLMSAHEGGQALRQWASIANETNEAFAEMVRTDPTEALSRYAEGLRHLKNTGTELLPILQEMGFNNIRERRIIAGLVLGYDVLNKSREEAARQVAILNGELDEETSIQEELERRLNTVTFQWRRFRAQLGVVIQVIGEQLLPNLRNSVDWLLENRHVLAVTGSSIITFIQLMRYLARTVSGAGHVIVGVFAGIGGAISELSVQMENFFAGMGTIGERYANLRSKMAAGTATPADWFGLAGIRFKHFETDEIAEAFHRHATVMYAGFDVLDSAVRDYIAHLNEIPDIQARMLGSIIELSNNVDDALIRSELVGIIDEWEEGFSDSVDGIESTMQKLFATLAMLDRYEASYRLIDPEFSADTERVSALNTALKALSTEGLTLLDADVQTVIALLQQFGADIDDIVDKTRQLQAELTARYLRNIELSVHYGDMDPWDAIDELKFQEKKLEKLAQQAVQLELFDDAEGIVKRLNMVRDALKALLELDLSHTPRGLFELLSGAYTALAPDESFHVTIPVEPILEWGDPPPSFRRDLNEKLEESQRWVGGQSFSFDVPIKPEIIPDWGTAIPSFRRDLNKKLEESQRWVGGQEFSFDVPIKPEIIPDWGDAVPSFRRDLNEKLEESQRWVGGRPFDFDVPVQMIIVPDWGDAEDFFSDTTILRKTLEDAYRALPPNEAFHVTIPAEPILEWGTPADEALKELRDAYKSTMDEILQAAGRAPSQFEMWRKVINDLAEATGVWTEEMLILLGLINELEAKSLKLQFVEDLQKGVNIAASFVDGFRAFQDGDIEAGLRSTGSAIAEIAGSLAGIPGLGALFESTFNTVISLIGDMSSGMKEVNEQMRNMESRFLLFNAEDLIRTKRVSRGGLLGLFGFTKTGVDEELTGLRVNIAQAIESGMVSGFTTGVKEFLISGQWNDLTKVVKEALLDGLIQAYMQSEVFKAIFGDALAAYIDDPSRENAERVLAGVGEFQDFWYQVRDDFGEFFFDLHDALDNLGEDEYQVLRPITDESHSNLIAPLPTINPILGAPSWIMEMGSHVTRFGEYVTYLTEEGIPVHVNQSQPTGAKVSQSSLRAARL